MPLQRYKVLLKIWRVSLSALEDSSVFTLSSASCSVKILVCEADPESLPDRLGAFPRRAASCHPPLQLRREDNIESIFLYDERQTCDVQVVAWPFSGQLGCSGRTIYCLEDISMCFPLPDVTSFNSAGHRGAAAPRPIYSS